MRNGKPYCLKSSTIWHSFWVITLFFFSCFTTSAQYFTPTIDGVISANEYGNHTNGVNQQTNSTTTWYMTWDANNLYLAYTGSNITEGGVLYLDHNPIIPVNGGTDAEGSTTGYATYDRNQMMQPFRSDFALYFKDSYHEYRHADGAGYWGAQTANSLSMAFNGGTLTLEIAIPWNVVTNGNGKTFSIQLVCLQGLRPGADRQWHLSWSTHREPYLCL